MEQSINLKRKLLPYGFAVEYQLKLELKKFHLPLLVDGCLKSLLPEKVYTERELIDIKGRDPLNLIDQSVPESHKPDADELLYIAGEILACESMLPVKGWQGKKVPFEVRVNSRFKEFVGAKHISHTLQVERKGAIPHDLPVRDLGWVFPIRIKNFRFGMDFFVTQFLSSMFGFAPTVFQTLLIEADEQQACLKISSEGMKSRDSVPLPNMDQLDRILGRAFGVSIKELYQKKVSSA